MHTTLIILKKYNRTMKKLLLLITIICFSVALSAQDLVNIVFDNVSVGSKSWYKGQQRDKKPHGMGVRSKDRTLYFGDFSHGQINGQGMMLSAQGKEISNCKECVMYVGFWKNGWKNGMGTCYSENGDIVYSGRFENDKPVETYPSEGDFLLKYFSVNEYDDGSKYWGELENGLYHGFGVYAWGNGDLWFGIFKEGTRKGVGFYLYSDANWEVLNFDGDSCTQINTSDMSKEKEAYHQAARAEIRAINRKILAEGLLEATTGILGAVTEIHAITTNHQNSGSTNSNYNSGNNNSSSSGSSSKGANTSNTSSKYCDHNWRTDSRTYSSYETQLIKMRTDSNYTSDYTDIQSKMKQIREKWEKRGCKITKSQYE